MEQGLHKLKVKEKKEFKIEIAYMAKVESINASNLYLLPLSSSFNFNLFFSILPNVISNNIPVPFL